MTGDPRLTAAASIMGMALAGLTIAGNTDLGANFEIDETENRVGHAPVRGRVRAERALGPGGVAVTATEPLHRTPAVDELEQRLQLGEWSTPAELVALLRERRADQLAALDARDPFMGPSASMLRLRVTQRAEVEMCEQALALLGAPFEPEDDPE